MQANVRLAIERMVSEVFVVKVRVHVQAFATEMKRTTVVGYDALAILSNLRLPQPLKSKTINVRKLCKFYESSV